MRKILLMLICCIASTIGYAQTAPKWMEKAKKAVFSIVTYDKDNKIKNTGNGFYISENGMALSDYTLFEGAQRAVIINAYSRELPVLSIQGANSMYDVVKFNTAVEKKSDALTPATRPAAVGETVYLLPYSTQKETTCQTGKVTQVDTIGNNAFYYTISMTTTEKTVSCPIMNANGEVLGQIQKNASSDAKESYAIGVAYGASLNISAIAASDMTLNKIGIKKALPDTEEQALVYLYMSSSQLSKDDYETALNDFLTQYPNSADGYIRRATFYMGYGSDGGRHYAQAQSDMDKALAVTTNKSETLYNIAKLIHSFNLSLTDDQQTYGDWTYDKALSNIREAISINSMPIYVQLEGDLLFAKRQYAEAYTVYDKVNQSELASAATYYSAAKAKQLMEGSDMNEAVALLDSAVNYFNKPYTSDAAPYFYERAEMKLQMGKYREAVIDYNTFYEAIGGRVTAAFYYQREQAEIQCKMYKQAIDDINKAAEMTPQDATVWLEKGAVHLRVSQYDEAVVALNKAISLDPKEASAYRILGFCQIQQKKNQEACDNLNKAKELGDDVAEELLQKYCK